MQTVLFEKNDALLIVDLQNDFLPQGALAIPRGDEVITVINQLVESAKKAAILVIASQDWHPPHHQSFKTEGGIWPVHCVANTWGAAITAALHLPKETIVVHKGTEIDKEAYSALEGKTNTGQTLVQVLQQQKIQRVWVCGLALDYCVKATALDLVKLGYQTQLIRAATRAVDQKTGEAAYLALQAAGVVLL